MESMSGTRLFSIKEIKDMGTSKRMPEDFKAYLTTAPEGVAKVLKRWFGEDWDSIINNSNDYSETSDLDSINDNESVEQSEVLVESLDKLQLLNQIYQLLKERLDFMHSPYKMLEFKDRIEVDGVWIYITNDNKCPVHNIDLEDIQLVVKYDQRKRFGIITRCCKSCKRIYCTQSEAEKILKNISDKNIPGEVLNK